MAQKTLSGIVDVRHSILRHPTEKYKVRTLEQIEALTIHQSMTDEGNSASFARHHVNVNGWPGIGYIFVILTDGTIEQCNDLTTMSYHVGDYNRYNLGICLVGDFRKSKGSKKPTKEQMESLFQLMDYLQGILPNAKQIKGHSEYKGYEWKECPGIDMDTLRNDYENWKVEDVPAKTKVQPWKAAGILNLGDKGILTQPLEWIEKIDEPWPVWAEGVVVTRLLDRIEKLEAEVRKLKGE